jgi:sec-independent protein translocase protein TatB
LLGEGFGRCINSRQRCPVCLRGYMMKRMSFSETVFLFFLALIIFGPKKLPEIARQVGKFMNEFRRASNEFKSQIEQEISQLELEKETKILPTYPQVEGTTSRSWSSSDTESKAAEPPATLAAPNEEPASPARTNGAEAGATEAAHPSDAVTSSSSQESHA